MNHVARNSLAAFFLSAIVLMPAAEASPMLIGSGLTLNFNFASPPQTPPPPYFGIFGSVMLSSQPGAHATLDIYDGLTGTGTLQSTFDLAAGSALLYSTQLPALVDGLFSFVFHRVPGSAEDATVSVSLQGITSTGSLTPVLSGVAVSEPSVLALLGIGIAGLSALSKRRLRWPGAPPRVPWRG
jgi:hypothetical protein